MKTIETEKGNLLRDIHTGALVSVDRSGLEKRRAMKKRHVKQTEEIEQMKSDISEIKSMLEMLVTGK